MSVLYGRAYELLIGNKFNNATPGLKITKSQISFEIEHELSGNPPKLDLKIFNLSKPSIDFIRQNDNLVSIKAGYNRDIGSIFVGDILRVWHDPTPPNVITNIESGAGLNDMRAATLAKTYSEKTSIQNIMGEAAEAMGKVLGDVKTAITDFVDSGFSVNTTASNLMDRLGDRADFDWFFDQEKVHVLGRKLTINDQAVLVSAKTGMVGSPTRTKDGIKVSMLLNAAVKVGYLVFVESLQYSGFFKVMKTSHIGDFRGASWFTNFEAVEVNA